MHNTTDQALQRVDSTPTLAAVDAEAQGRVQGKRLAELQYLPDFSLSGGTDVIGIAQTLSAMITAPILRYQSINAAIAKAEANIRTSEAARRQTGLDLRGRVIADLALIADADRQLDLLEYAVLPRVGTSVDAARSEYEAGNTPFADLLDAQRSLITIQRMDVELRVFRGKAAADLDAGLGTLCGGI